MMQKEKIQTSNLGIELIKHYEGNRLEPYLCPANVATIGIGHAIINPETNEFLKGESGLKIAKEMFKNFTLADSIKLLKKDLVKYEDIVKKNITIALEQYEFDALVSHTFNTGGSETLFNLVNKQLKDSIKTWWCTKYISAGDKILNGLVARRKDEYNLFSTGELKFTN